MLKMAPVLFVSFLILGFSTLSFADIPKSMGSDLINTARVAVLDIRTKDIDTNTSQVLSDILRTELFKLHVFKILERSQINSIIDENKLQLSGFIDDQDLLKVGRLLSVDKLAVMTVGSMAKNIAINIRVINVEKATLDFSENVFITSQESMIDAIKDIAKKIEVYYVLKQERNGGENKKEILKLKWTLLGANIPQSEFLLSLQSEPDIYLDLRQYDITFTIEDYIKTIKNGWDPAIIKSFLKEGIPYHDVVKALSLGITDLNHYRSTFKEKNYSFNDYLLAYENHILNVDEYYRFKEGYRRDRFIIGAGGAADSFPIANANFKFLTAQLGWEHFWSPYQRDLFKYSMEMGFNMLNGVLPAPYFQFNGYIGTPPFYAKLSVGTLAEVILGGHIGGYIRVGVETLEFLEFNIVVVPIGTAPGISYTDLKTRKGEPGYIPINYPYFGAFLCVKL